MIAVIDYGIGNLRSVLNAFGRIDAAARVVDRASELNSADAIVLPGVGAFGDGMSNLRARGFVTALNQEVQKKSKPFLGICLGLQLLADLGLEHGEHAGLCWVSGDCTRLDVSADNPDTRVPHVGWNDVTFTKADGLFKDMGAAATFYFVHSFALRPRDAKIVSGTCDHGGPFVASIEAGNISATQFHPEKSQKAGLQVLRNWCDMAAC